jgi:hypothetical protein
MLEKGFSVFRTARFPSSSNITKKHTLHRKIQAILAEIGNPFEEESSELYALDTKDVVDSQVAENMARLPDTGKKHERSLVDHIFYSGTI